MHAFWTDSGRISCEVQSAIVYHTVPSWSVKKSIMIRVALHLFDPSQRLLLNAMLERANCAVSPDRPDVVICDDFDEAVRQSEATPTLVVIPLNDVSRAVDVMARGVWGYITYPFQPDEAAIMVRRAANAGTETAFEPRPLAEVEADHIRAVLRHCNGNRSRAAKLLGIGRNTLWRKLAALEAESES